MAQKAGGRLRLLRGHHAARSKRKDPRPWNRTKYSYNNAGNTLTYSNATFTYYNSGRVKTVKVGASTTTYVYNAIGQRIKKSGGSAGTVLTVIDEAGHLIGEYSSTGSLVQETVWLGDTPVATIRPNGSSVTIYYVHADHLNAPRMVTRPSDNKIAWRWDADPFATVAPNQNPKGLGTFVYNLRYPGQYYDSETGLSYNFFRDYDPLIGRYIEPDPIGLQAAIGPYTYVSASPLSLVDPKGLWGIGVSGGGMAEAGDGWGGAITRSSGSGLFFGCGSSQRLGAFTNAGSFASSSRANTSQFVIGASAGLGSGFWLSNASAASQLLGGFDTWSLNLPAISFQFAISNGTWVGSASFGRSFGFSFSRYPVVTQTATGTGTGATCGCE